MNVLETINTELKDRHLTDFEKVVYIYNRCMKIFHFDSRWFYTGVWDDSDLSKLIWNRKINLENVSDFAVICRSFSSQVLAPLINNFTSDGCDLILGETNNFVEYTDHNGMIWKLDAAHGDFARGKIDLAPNGFTTVGINDQFDEACFDLGFEFKTAKDYRDTIDADNFTDMYRQIGFLLDSTEAKYHYTDANFLVQMLAYLFMHCGATYLDRDYHFHNLIETCDREAYFDLSKDDEYYSLKEIDKEKYNYLTKILVKKQ